MGFRTKSARNGLRAAVLAGAAVAAFGLGGLNAGTASAALSCQGENIKGEGSSLQKEAQINVWTKLFSANICNKGTHETVTYSSVGSGAGLAQWNSDGALGHINTEFTFIGSDDAPTKAQLSNMESVAGGANVAVIPVAQTSIAIIANPPVGCEVTQITNQELEKVFEGVTIKWSKLEGATGGAACEKPIVRVVRKDGSGTSYQFKNYLSGAKNKALACTTGLVPLGEGETDKNRTWTELEPITNGTTGEPNTGWPEKCAEATFLTKLVRPNGTGGGEEVAKVKSTEGAIGYAAYPDALAGGAKTLEVQNNGQVSFETATFAAPGNGSEANCNATKYVVPTEARRGEGSGLSADWSKVFGAKATIGGTAYPLCTLTYDLAFSKYSLVGYSQKAEITAHDYLKEYVEAATGQADIVASGKGYNGAPSSTVKANNVLGAGQYAAEKIGF
jgi:ABC-type phosphate transport system substrate-binding protein